jgi:signal transduction histidine kinase
MALLTPAEAISAQLRVLCERGPLTELSIWTTAEHGGLRCLAHASGSPSGSVRAAARAALRGEGTPPGPRRTIVALPIGVAESPTGALAARVPPGRSAEALALLAEAAPLLAWMLESRRLREAVDRQDGVVAATDRRLVRFGLDLHDGPLQEAAALLSDLRLFARQLRSELARHPMAEILAGRTQDLEMRTVALEAGIRELARTAGGPAVFEGSLPAALRAEAQAFARATGVTPTLEVVGPVDQATDSQRLTVLHGVQEALRNARQHSGADSVMVRVEAPSGRLEARIEDNGHGFAVARAMSRARREGRLGVTGIDQRARLLGGRCSIVSKPGGPTVVNISLPRWAEGESPRTSG